MTLSVISQMDPYTLRLLNLLAKLGVKSAQQYLPMDWVLA
jgi:hypothetical protein